MLKWTSWLVIITGALAGCGGPTAALCRQKASCSGDDSNLGQCVDDAREADQEAKDMGCGPEWVSQQSCIQRNSTCDNGNLRLESLDVCSEQIGDFTQCAIGGLF